MRLEVSRTHKHPPQNKFTDSLRLRSLTVFNGHRRPVHNPLFVRHFYAPIIPNLTPCPSSVLKYKRRNEGPSRILNLMVFFILFVPSLVGAIGLAVRGASQKGKGLCEEFISKHPESCSEAAVAITLAWVSVVIGAHSSSLASYVVDLTVH